MGFINQLITGGPTLYIFMYIPLINAAVNQLMDSTAHVRTEAVVSRSDRAAKIELWALATVLQVRTSLIAE